MENTPTHIEEDEKHDQNVSSQEMELDMIRATLLLNPENLNLTASELDRMVTEEYKQSRA